MEKHIRHLNQAEVISLANQIAYLPNQVVSKTLSQNSALTLTLFAFDAEEEISAHESKGDAMITVLDGVGLITIEEQQYVVETGQTIILPAGKPHAVFAKQPFKMLLLVVFPVKKVTK